MTASERGMIHARRELHTYSAKLWRSRIPADADSVLKLSTHDRASNSPPMADFLAGLVFFFFLPKKLVPVR